MIEISIGFCIFIWAGMAILALTNVYLFKYIKEIGNSVYRLDEKENCDGSDLEKILGILSVNEDKFEEVFGSIARLRSDIQNVKCSLDAFDECERKYKK